MNTTEHQLCALGTGFHAARRREREVVLSGLHERRTQTGRLWPATSAAGGGMQTAPWAASRTSQRGPLSEAAENKDSGREVSVHFIVCSLQGQWASHLPRPCPPPPAKTNHDYKLGTVFRS